MISCNLILHLPDNSVVLQCIVTPSGPSVTASKANAFSSTDLETRSLPRSLLATTLLPSTDVTSIPESDSVDDFTEGEVLGDELDSILDSIADGSQYPLVRVTFVDAPLFYSLLSCIFF